MKDIWTKEIYDNYVNDLKRLQDLKYLEFNKGIIPNTKEMIGVRMPLLKKKAREISKSDVESFINYYKGEYFEETMMLGLVIGYTLNINVYDKYLEFFSKEISDWAVCDGSVKVMKLIKKERSHFYPFVLKMLKTNNEYQVRLALVILLNYYITDEYILKLIEICKKVKSDKYYINMALAWLICEMYIFYPDLVDVLISDKYLDKFVLNKTISKISDSYRVSDECKKNLKLRRKK